ERVRGEPADIRTDLYGLGLVMYEAATGRPAAVGDSPAELAQQQLEVHPPRPREVNPNVPPELESVMARLLAKNRDARLPNANAAIEELVALIDSGTLDGAGAAVAAPPPPMPPPDAPADDETDYYETEEPIAAAA